MTICGRVYVLISMRLWHFLHSINPLTANVCSANQLTGFYMIGTLAVKGLKCIFHQFLCQWFKQFEKIKS